MSNTDKDALTKLEKQVSDLSKNISGKDKQIARLLEQAKQIDDRELSSSLNELGDLRKPIEQLVNSRIPKDDMSEEYTTGIAALSDKIIALGTQLNSMQTRMDKNASTAADMTASAVVKGETEAMSTDEYKEYYTLAVSPLLPTVSREDARKHAVERGDFETVKKLFDGFQETQKSDDSIDQTNTSTSGSVNGSNVDDMNLKSEFEFSTSDFDKKYDEAMGLNTIDGWKEWAEFDRKYKVAVAAGKVQDDRE